MSLRFSVLGLLVEQPLTGYDIARKFDVSLAHAWHANHSQIYPELARLEEAGLIEVVGEGPRRSKTYAATRAGRNELRVWLLETEPNRSVRNETAVRWFLVGLLPPVDQREVYTRELAFMEGHDAFMHDLDEKVPEDAPFRPTVELGLEVNRVMIAWLRKQLARLDAAG